MASVSQQIGRILANALGENIRVPDVAATGGISGYGNEDLDSLLAGDTASPSQPLQTQSLQTEQSPQSIPRLPSATKAQNARTSADVGQTVTDVSNFISDPGGYGKYIPFLPAFGINIARQIEQNSTNPTIKGIASFMRNMGQGASEWLAEAPGQAVLAGYNMFGSAIDGENFVKAKMGTLNPYADEERNIATANGVAALLGSMGGQIAATIATGGAAAEFMAARGIGTTALAEGNALAQLIGKLPGLAEATSGSLAATGIAQGAIGAVANLEPYNEGRISGPTLALEAAADAVTGGLTAGTPSGGMLAKIGKAALGNTAAAAVSNLPATLIDNVPWVDTNSVEGALGSYAGKTALQSVAGTIMSVGEHAVVPAIQKAAGKIAGEPAAPEPMPVEPAAPKAEETPSAAAPEVLNVETPSAADPANQWAANWYDANQKDFFRTAKQKEAAAKNLGIDPDEKGRYERVAFVRKIADIVREDENVSDIDLREILRGEKVSAKPEPIVQPEQLPSESPTVTQQPAESQASKNAPPADNSVAAEPVQGETIPSEIPIESQIVNSLENSYMKAARTAWNEGDDMVRMGFDIDNADKRWEQLTPGQQQQASYNLTPKKERIKAVEEFTRIAQEGQQRRAAPVEELPQEAIAEPITAPAATVQPEVVKESLTTEARAETPVFAPDLPKAEQPKPSTRTKRAPATEVTFDELASARETLAANPAEGSKRMGVLQTKGAKFGEAKARAILERLDAEGAGAPKAEQPLKEDYTPTPEEEAAGKLTGNDWAKARELGYFVKDGVKVARQPDLIGTGKAIPGKQVQSEVKGGQGGINFSNDEPRVPYRWVISEADDFQATEKQGRKNFRHFGAVDWQPNQGTTSSNTATFTAQTLKNFSPQEVFEGASAYSGAPVGNARGESLNGTGRKNLIDAYWEYSPDDKAGMKEYYKNMEVVHGIPAETIDKFKRPLIWRMVEADDAEAKRLSGLNQRKTERVRNADSEDYGDALSTKKETIDKATNWLKGNAFGADADNFDTALKSKGEELRDILSEGSPVRKAKLGSTEALKEHLVTMLLTDGGADARAAMDGKIGTPKMMNETAQAAIYENVPAFYLDDGELRKAFVGALKMHAEHQRSSPDAPIGEWLSHITLNGKISDSYDANAIAMHALLANAPRKEVIARALNDYVQALQSKERPPDMFGTNEGKDFTNLGTHLTEALTAEIRKLETDPKYAKVAGRSVMLKNMRTASLMLNSTPSAALAAAGAWVPDDDEPELIPGIKNSSLKKFLLGSAVTSAAALGGMMTLRGAKNRMINPSNFSKAKATELKKWHEQSGYADAGVRAAAVTMRDADKLVMAARLYGHEDELISIGQKHLKEIAPERYTEMAPEDFMRLGARELLRDAARLSGGKPSGNPEVSNGLADIIYSSLDESGAVVRPIAQRALRAVEEVVRPEMESRIAKIAKGEKGSGGKLAAQTERQLKALLSDGRIGGKVNDEGAARIVREVFGMEAEAAADVPKGYNIEQYQKSLQSIKTQLSDEFSGEALRPEQVVKGFREEVAVALPKEAELAQRYDKAKKQYIVMDADEVTQPKPLMMAFSRKGLNDIPEYMAANKKVKEKIQADMESYARTGDGKVTAEEMQEILARHLDYAVQLGEDTWVGKFVKAVTNVDSIGDVKASIDKTGGELPLFGGEVILRKHHPEFGDRGNYAIELGENFRKAMSDEYYRGHLTEAQAEADDANLEIEKATTDTYDEFEQLAGHTTPVERAGVEEQFSANKKFLGKESQLPSWDKLLEEEKKKVESIVKITGFPSDVMMKIIDGYAINPDSQIYRNALNYLAKATESRTPPEFKAISEVKVKNPQDLPPFDEQPVALLNEIIENHYEYWNKLRQFQEVASEKLPKNWQEVLAPQKGRKAKYESAGEVSRPVSAMGTLTEADPEAAKEMLRINYEGEKARVQAKQNPAEKPTGKPKRKFEEQSGQLFLHPNAFIIPITAGATSALDDEEEYFGVKGKNWKRILVPLSGAIGMRSLRNAAVRRYNNIIGSLGNAKAKIRLQNLDGKVSQEVMDAKIAALEASGAPKGSKEWNAAMKEMDLVYKNGKITHNTAAAIAERMRQSGYDSAANPEAFDAELQSRLQEYNDLAKGVHAGVHHGLGVQYFANIGNKAGKEITGAATTAEQWIRGKSKEAADLHDVFVTQRAANESKEDFENLKNTVGKAVLDLDYELSELRKKPMTDRKAAYENLRNSGITDKKKIGAEARKIAADYKKAMKDSEQEAAALKEKILAKHFGTGEAGKRGREKWEQWETAASKARQIDIDRMIQKSMGIDPWSYKEQAESIRESVKVYKEQQAELFKKAAFATDPDDIAALGKLVETNHTNLFYAQRQAKMLDYFESLRVESDKYHYAPRWFDQRGEWAVVAKNDKGQTIRRKVGNSAAEQYAIVEEMVKSGIPRKIIERLPQKRAAAITKPLTRENADDIIARVFMHGTGKDKLDPSEAITLLQHTPEFSNLPPDVQQQTINSIQGKNFTREQMRYLLLGMWTRPMPNMLNRKNIKGYEPASGSEGKWMLQGFDYLINRSRESIEAHAVLHEALNQRQNMIAKGFDSNPMLGYINNFIDRVQENPYGKLSQGEIAFGKKLQRGAGFSTLALNATHFIKNIMFGQASLLGEITAQSKGGAISQLARGAGRYASALAHTTFYKAFANKLEKDNAYRQIWDTLNNKLDIGETQYLRQLLETDMGKSSIGKKIMIFSHSSEKFNNQISAMAAATRVLDAGGSTDEAIRAALGMRAATQGRFTAWATSNAEAKIRKAPGGVGIAAMALYSASFRAMEHYASLVHRGVRADNPKAAGMLAQAMALTAIGGLANVPIAGDAVHLWEWIESLTGERNEDRTVSEGGSEQVRRKTGELARKMGVAPEVGELFFDLMREGVVSMATNRNFTSDASLVSMAEPVVLSKIGNIAKVIGNFARSDNTFAEDFFSAAALLNTTVGRFARATGQALAGEKLDSKGNYTGEKYGFGDAALEIAGGRQMKDAVASRERFKKSGGIYDDADARDYVKAMFRLTGMKIGDESKSLRDVLASHAKELRRDILSNYEKTAPERAQAAKYIEDYISDHKKQFDHLLLAGAPVSGNTKKPARLAAVADAAVKDYYTGIALSAALGRRGIPATYEFRRDDRGAKDAKDLGAVKLAKKKLLDALRNAQK